MSIFQNGGDVTDEMRSRAFANAAVERRSTDNFLVAVHHLQRARDYLNELPVPWMNDCIHSGIDGIDRIIRDLQKD